jgi:hypothetical protein
MLCLLPTFVFMIRRQKWVAIMSSTLSEHLKTWSLSKGNVEESFSYGRSWSEQYFICQACGVAFETLFSEGSQLQKRSTEFRNKRALYFKDCRDLLSSLLKYFFFILHFKNYWRLSFCLDIL